ncbi:MAG: pitrilysin family protein, partial [Bdellovibrionota bacterium]
MITKFQLKNKMQVLMIESRKSPVVSVQMWVHNGSADERKGGEEGISHFIEHLVFKGTKNYKVGEIAKTVEGSGGELNAYTSFDQTVFYVTISSQFSEVALSVINEMMMHPQFDPQEIENEKEVVIEEIKRSNDSPHRQASRLLFEGFYKKHPYGIPVIGYEENIRKMTPKQIVSYYETRYIPSNMKLVVVGDFNSSEMKKKIIERYDIPMKRKLRVAKRTVEKKKSKGEILVKPSTFKETFAYMVWPLPNGYHKDIPALDILAMVLGHGESSRLMRSIKMEQHLVNSVGASSYTPKDPGLFGISASMNGDNLEKYLIEVKKELVTFFKSGITQEELSRALAQGADASLNTPRVRNEQSERISTEASGTSGMKDALGNTLL